jgi:arginine decarboxylase
MDEKLATDRAPLLEEMLRYRNESNISFHTPGHKGGRGLESWWQDPDWAGLDLTEVAGFDWQRGMEEAQTLAAALFRADRSFWLTQGATQGILAGLAGAFRPGDTVLIGRNCHSAVIKAVILADLNPVFVAVDQLPEWSIPAGVNFEALQAALQQHPEAAGGVFTNPTYQGIAGPVAAYRTLLGPERILFIDEAHGGHFEWFGRPEYNAHRAADLWVHGTHKLHGSLTQTGWLHLRRGRIDVATIAERLDLISTTSPSYLLLASLDSNRRFLAGTGARLFRERLAAILDRKERLRAIPGLSVLGEAALSGGRTVDPWKITLAASGLSGYRVAEQLRRDHQIAAEYADSRQVTLIAAPWQESRDWERLDSALAAVMLEAPALNHEAAAIPDAIPPLLMRPRQAAFARRDWVALAQARGRIAAGLIAPYPPGIPALVPGELIGPDQIAWLDAVVREGGWVNGMDRQERIPVLTE